MDSLLRINVPTPSVPYLFNAPHSKSVVEDTPQILTPVEVTPQSFPKALVKPNLIEVNTEGYKVISSNKPHEPSKQSNKYQTVVSVEALFKKFEANARTYSMFSKI